MRSFRFLLSLSRFVSDRGGIAAVIEHNQWRMSSERKLMLIARIARRDDNIRRGTVNLEQVYFWISVGFLSRQFKTEAVADSGTRPVPAHYCIEGRDLNFMFILMIPILQLTIDWFFGIDLSLSRLHDRP